MDTDIIEKNCHVRHIFACQLGQQEFVGENLVEPVLVTPRPVANRFPTALHAWKTTNLLALNSYISRDGDTSSGTVAVVRVSTLDASGKV